MRTALDLADNWLGLTRIELNVYTDNSAGIALYEKFGFEIEGTHRRFAFNNGRYADAYSMAHQKLVVGNANVRGSSSLVGEPSQIIRYVVP